MHPSPSPRIALADSPGRIIAAAGRIAAAACLLLAGGLFLAPLPAHGGPTFGFLEDFGDGTNGGFISQALLSNPGTGGVGGAGDGYLRIARPDTAPGHHGAFNAGPDYSGDYLAAGVTLIVFQLNDVEADQDFEYHLGIGNGGSFWQYNTGFAPPEQSWAEFEVDLTDSLNFTRIIGLGNYTLALTTVDRVLFRHDHPPFGQIPDSTTGELGLDHILLTGETTSTEPVHAPAAIRPLLLPARPNPTSAVTSIWTELDQPAQVRLTIVSAAGRIVRRLHSGALGAGPHLFPWDGRDERGLAVGAGVYLIRLESGQRAETGRVAVLR